jgi:hypothetical protein
VVFLVNFTYVKPINFFLIVFWQIENNFFEDGVFSGNFLILKLLFLSDLFQSILISKRLYHLGK